MPTPSHSCTYLVDDTLLYIRTISFVESKVPCNHDLAFCDYKQNVSTIFYEHYNGLPNVTLSKYGTTELKIKKNLIR